MRHQIRADVKASPGVLKTMASAHGRAQDSGTGRAPGTL
jgi:hypothetical protein